MKIYLTIDFMGDQCRFHKYKRPRCFIFDDSVIFITYKNSEIYCGHGNDKRFRKCLIG